VLDGYTPVTDAVVRPSLEERVVKKAEGTGRTERVEGKTIGPGSVLPLQPKDIHDKAKAAIAAEQSQPAADTFKPSQATVQERLKPVPEKRFTANEVPDFLKKPATPMPPSTPSPLQQGEKTPPASTAAAQPKPSTPSQPPLTSAPTELKADEGVKVTYQAPSTPPEIPMNSSEPVVKTVKPATPANPLTPESASAATEETPKPPKDPFALGDDGLTDIERALGGL
jgi:hypothetical protein